MQLAAGKNDFTDKDNLHIDYTAAEKESDQQPMFELNNKQFYHENNKPGKIIEMSDRNYIVAPDGSWRVYRNNEELDELKYKLSKKFL